MLHVYRTADLHHSVRLTSRAANVGFRVLGSEICFNVEVTGLPTADEQHKLEYLLRETSEPECCSTKCFLAASSPSMSIVEVGPRQQFTSAWSTNAVSICQAVGLMKITCVEQSRRYQVEALDASASLQDFVALAHDRMTECLYPNGIRSFEQHQEPAAWSTVPLMKEGRKALEHLSKEHGLGYDSQDIDYYMRVFKDELSRDPTIVECFDLAQGNSEHSRHWLFGGQLVIDGQAMPKTLFQWVKRPFQEHPSNSTIAFKDKRSALRGFRHRALFPEQRPELGACPGKFSEVVRDFDLTLTVETHNFPCGITPLPGAETGAGGRIRDGESTGQGSLVVAGIAGYVVGNLQLPGYDLPWEDKTFAYPSTMAPPLQILVDSSNGVSDYGNKFGEPRICGWTRNMGHRMPGGKRFEWVKPSMMSGGLGQMDHGHIEKQEPHAGQLVVKIGGPAGAASSMVAGDNAAELDLGA